MPAALRFDWDSETDVAAVVYGSDEDPDIALRVFAGRRAAQGEWVVGLLQWRAPATAERQRRVGFRMLALAQMVAEDIDLSGPDLRNHHPIGGMASALEADLASNPRVLIVNRFGRLECRGEGFFPLLVRASRLGIPAVVPIPVDHFPRWLEMGGGLAVRLPPNGFALERWWRSMEPDARAIGRRPAVCERSK